MRFLVDFKPPKSLWQEWGYVDAPSIRDAIREVAEGYQSLSKTDGMFPPGVPKFRATRPKTFTVVASQRFTVEATSPEAAADKVKGIRISDEATFAVAEATR
jgi:hypothetical protein